jgi:geranylgeranyl pyrophosphate synthase
LIETKIAEPIRVENRLDWQTGDLDQIEKTLGSVSARYSRTIPELARGLFSAGGKRMRPLLTCGVIRCLGGSPAEFAEVVVTSEVVHTASLIHDDVVDGTRTRRGAPAAHVAFDPKTAVLAGDFLLAEAMRTIALAGRLDLLDLAACTIRDLVEGEVYEWEKTFDPDQTVETVRTIQQLKTASLFEYATRSGAMLVDADKRIIEQAGRFGRGLGLAFQAVDDLLDWTGDAGTVGKPVGQDLLEGKLNLPAAIGVSNDPGLMEMIKQCWDAEDCNGEGWIQKIRERLENDGAIEKARKLADEDVADALSAIENWPEGPVKDDLGSLAQQIVQRDS